MIDEETVLGNETTRGLGEIRLRHPPGTFALTPASHTAIRAVCDHQDFLVGEGIDWGSGVGCLAIVAAKIPAVRCVVGLEISSANVEVAKENAVRNSVQEKVTFLVSDSYTPLLEADRGVLKTHIGRARFILANPPSSEGDDGFEFRRIVLRGAREYLVRDGVVLLSISSQYGPQRIEDLCRQIAGFAYGGMLASTDWVPFDLSRADLLHCLDLYAEEERQNGAKYAFRDPSISGPLIDARTAQSRFHKTGLSPLTQWQSHLFRYTGASPNSAPAF